MSRRKMAPVYIGDVGEIVVPQPKVAPPPDLDLNKLTFRQLCNLAVACNLDLRDIIGVSSCDKHYTMVFLGDKELPQGYNLFEDAVYCKNCWRYFRYRDKRVFE